MRDAVRKNVEGLKLYQEGKYEEALRKYNEAIEMDAGYAAPWINRSAVHRKLGREAEADDDMKWYESLRQAERTKEPTLVENVVESAEPVTPARLEVEYPERLSRLLLFVKWLFAIPLYIWLALYGIGASIATGLAFWAILFTGRYPEGMFDFVEEYLDYQFRVYAYFPLMMNDSWPPSPDEVGYEVDYPDRLSRLVLVFLKLPSFLLSIVTGLIGLVLCFLCCIAIPVWFVILLLGKYPRRLFNFNVRLFEWVTQVTAWQWLMRDNWSLFGTTRPVQIIVIIGLVAMLTLSAIEIIALVS